jgi:glutaredoxin
MKKFLLLFIVSALLTGLSFMTYVIIERVNHKRLTRGHLESLDNFLIYDFDSTRFHLSSYRKRILIYFDSECDHCQYQLSQIFSHRKSFDDSDIVLLSSELISTIKLYAERNYPLDAGNVYFAKINQLDAYNTFGSLAVPQIFIYGTDGILVKDFKGETKVDAVLQYL